MIKPGYIKKQVKKSRQSGFTTSFLKQLVFLVVDQALKEHYQKEYPIRCLQASEGVKMILQSIGINSTLIEGAACFAQPFKYSDKLTWSGFWDKDHHYWLYTEFSEIVDLAINYLHLHPNQKDDDIIPIPAIWWKVAGYLPHSIWYIPFTNNFSPLKGGLAADLVKFKGKVRINMNESLDNCNANDISFSPILTGFDSWNSLLNQGNLWLTKVIACEEEKYPPPQLIQKRYEENEKLRQRLKKA